MYPEAWRKSIVSWARNLERSRTRLDKQFSLDQAIGGFGRTNIAWARVSGSCLCLRVVTLGAGMQVDERRDTLRVAAVNYMAEELQ
jgi:hypothetical protein